MKIMIRNILIVCSLLVVGTAVDCLSEGGFVVGEVEARVGRPLTPVSVAGVARRTTRRTIRRTSVYVATLPVGCTTMVIEGTTLQQCGTTYYQPHNNQYVVVNVQ
jgi:hypothetical protein